MSNRMAIFTPEAAFPEITNLQRACRLCQLVRANPKVLYVVHELYRRGLQGQELHQRVRSVFLEAEETLPARPTFKRHLRTHCLWAERGETTILVPAVTGQDRATTSTFRSDALDAETDYIELRRLYEDFRTIFTTVKTKFETGKDAEPPSDYGLTMLVRLAGELRQMLKTLSDMRNSEKLFSLVLLRHTESLMEFLTEPLGHTLQEIRDQLANGGDPKTVAARLDQLLGGEIFPLFENAATQALEKSRQQYRLH